MNTTGAEILANETPCGDQSAILAYLSAPDNLAPGTPKRILTHGAYVFLAGDRAYKLKRQVRYAYMDFSSQALRDAAALAEIRLNRRTAPDLYLGLAPIFKDAGGVRIGPVCDDLLDGAAEHLVVMQRFNDTDTLDARADRGAIDGDIVEALAVQIARFHDAAMAAPREGAAKKLAAVSDRTMDDLAAGAAALGAETIAMLQDAMRAAVDQGRSEIDERGKAGLVRRLHGDLHLGNAALIDGAPVIFDALEFDDAMATVDVLHDAAFLGMDLWTRGLKSEASRMWSRYLAEREDFSGLALAPLYFSMRACVRAKTALHRSRLMEDEASRVALAEAQRYAVAALALLERPIPRLIAVGGLSGSGKTAIARKFAPAMSASGGAIHIRSDIIRKLREGVAAEDKLPSGAYTKQASMAVYETMFDQAETCLKQGMPVILDAVFADPAERIAAEAVAKRCALPFIGVWLESDLAVRQARIAQRVGDASDATPAVAERQATYDVGDMHWRRLPGNAEALDVSLLLQTS